MYLASTRSSYTYLFFRHLFVYLFVCCLFRFKLFLIYSFCFSFLSYISNRCIFGCGKLQV
ncbi:hypothetical protein BDZ91DRAFT_748285 [Kalaharituber pfeilii]|nr:hypothetical protein BDZ91DRAFT_748285 [Kalaharituber pfeilii]